MCIYIYIYFSIERCLHWSTNRGMWPCGFRTVRGIWEIQTWSWIGAINRSKECANHVNYIELLHVSVKLTSESR